MLDVKMLYMDMLHTDTLSPPCFLITLLAASHFPLTHVWKKAFQKKIALGLSPANSYNHNADHLRVTLSTLTQPVTFFPLCTNTWLIANWWAALIHIPSFTSIADLGDTCILIAGVVYWRQLLPVPPSSFLAALVLQAHYRHWCIHREMYKQRHLMHLQRPCWLITYWGAQSSGRSQGKQLNPSSLCMETGLLLQW